MHVWEKGVLIYIPVLLVVQMCTGRVAAVNVSVGKDALSLARAHRP